VNRVNVTDEACEEQAGNGGSDKEGARKDDGEFDDTDSDYGEEDSEDENEDTEDEDEDKTLERAYDVEDILDRRRLVCSLLIKFDI
jgi:hypothetical protein